MLMQFRCFGKRARLREIERAFDLGLDLAVDLRARRRVEPFAERRHRIAGLPARSFLALAEAQREILARPDVLEPAIRHALDERRAGTFAHGADKTLRRGMQREHVVLLDALGRHAMRAHTPADVLGRLALALVRMDGVAVVLADEEDRQLL